MVLISHSLLLPETLSGEKRTTWRKDSGSPNQMWARVRRSLMRDGAVTGHHYWKVRVRKDLKPLHQIGTSQITAVVPRHIDTISQKDAVLDGFKGSVVEMRLALALIGSSHENYWQIFYDPGWVR